MRRWIVMVTMGLAPNVVLAGAADLAWLAGTWCGDSGGVYNEEVWLAPRGGSLLGMHRDTRAGALRGFEFLRIVEDGGELVYWAQPEGAPAVPFRAAAPSGQSVDFVNAGHDFPKRIRYRRLDANTLYARIDDGTDAGRHREWTWRRDCAP